MPPKQNHLQERQSSSPSLPSGRSSSSPKFRFIITILFVLAIIVLSTSFSISLILLQHRQENQHQQHHYFDFVKNVAKSIQAALSSFSFSSSERHASSASSNRKLSTNNHQQHQHHCFLWTNIIQTRTFNSCLVEPIDAVYTWVNGSDPLHAKARLKFLSQSSTFVRTETANTTPSSPPKHDHDADADNDDRASANRFADNDELLYSLRGLEQYAGDWVRHVYIVTNGQVPSWLDMNSPATKSKVSIVTHMEIFSNPSILGDSKKSSSYLAHLPVFSSSSIESHLHRIPYNDGKMDPSSSLSAKFLYLNDDTFFGAPVVLDDFYCPVAGHKIFLSWQIPLCNDGCQPGWISDNYCDNACNVESCDWDGGDCVKQNSNKHQPGGGGGGYNSVDVEEQRRVAEMAARLKECSPGCNVEQLWIGDRFCDKRCNTSECGFDGGDCGMEPFAHFEGGRMVVQSPRFEYPHSGGGASGRNTHNPSSRNLCLVENFTLLTATTTTTTSVSVCNRTLEVPASAFDVSLFLDGENASSNNGQNFDALLTARIETEWTKHVALLFNMSEIFVVSAASAAATNDDDDDNNHDFNNSILMSSLINKNKRLESAYFYDTTIKNVHFPHNPKDFGNCNDLIRASVYSSDSSSLILVFPSRERIFELWNDSQSDNEQQQQQHQFFCFSTFDFKINNSHQVVLNLNFSFQGVLEKVIQLQMRRDILMTKNSSNIHDNIEIKNTKQEDGEILTTSPTILLSTPISSSIDNDDDVDGATQRGNSGFEKEDRELLSDAFGDSLRYSNRLLNRRFGKQQHQRKAPAHMAHLIQKEVISELWALHPEHWGSTSASRFRSGDNIQYGFMHMYYLMHAERTFDEDYSIPVLPFGVNTTTENASASEEPSPETLFFSKYLDVDGSGVVEVHELRRIALLLYEKKVSLEFLQEQFIQKSLPDDGQEGKIQDEKNEENNGTIRHEANDESNENERNNTSSAITTTILASTTASPVEKERDDFLHPDDGSEPIPNYVLLLEERVIPMSNKYLRAVLDLVGQASAGIKFDLCDVPPSSSSSSPSSSSADVAVLTPAQFRRSHLAKLITPLFKEPRYATELQTLEDVTFFMIRDNSTVVRHQMDHIIQKRPKYFCINDNMNRTRKSSFRRVSKLLAEFFETYFPHPSRFEKQDQNQRCQTSSSEYIWQHPAWIQKVGTRAAALARALQHGATYEEFLAEESSKWMPEFQTEVMSKIVVNNNDADRETSPTSRTEEQEGELFEVKIIFAVSSFLILLVLVVVVFVKCV